MVGAVCRRWREDEVLTTRGPLFREIIAYRVVDVVHSTRTHSGLREGMCYDEASSYIWH